MRIPVTAATAGLLCAALAAPLAAQDFEAPVAARKGQFRILALNLGVLGGMARGTLDYDAEAAAAAADNIAAVASLNQSFNWPEGSDAQNIDISRAEPSIWENPADFQSNWDDLGEQAAALQDAAGAGQQALGPALGQVGGACRACHDQYRTPE